MGRLPEGQGSRLVLSVALPSLSSNLSASGWAMHRRNEPPKKDARRSPFFPSHAIVNCA